MVLIIAAAMRIYLAGAYSKRDFASTLVTETLSRQQQNANTVEVQLQNVPLNKDH